MRRFFGFFTSRIRSARVTSKIAFRNLMRQFRRNVLLSAGIAVGMCILVITASFTSGLTDIIFNKVLVYMSGHIKVVMDEYTSRRSDVIRDTARFTKIITDNVDGIRSIDPQVSAFGRIVGNGRTGLVALVGIAKDADFYKDTQLESGSPRDMYKPDVFPGILLYKNAAKELNVGMNDTVTVRFQTVYGQAQAPKFKVVGLIPSSNMFMDVAAFVDMETLRGLLNLKPNESLGLQIVTKYPEDAAEGHCHGEQAPEGVCPGGRRGESHARGRRTPGESRRVRAAHGDEHEHPGRREEQPHVPRWKDRRPAREQGRDHPHAAPGRLDRRDHRHEAALQLHAPGLAESCRPAVRRDGNREAGGTVRRRHRIRARGCLLQDLLLEHSEGSRQLSRQRRRFSTRCCPSGSCWSGAPIRTRRRRRYAP